MVDAAGGTTLRTVLTQSGRLAPERAVAVVTQIAGELATGHSEGIPYRAAISPNEIILTAEGAAHLTTASTDDAGVAVAANDIDQVAYMAPERLLANAAPSQRTEVYALAGVLYECLTGTTPYSVTDGLPGLIAALQTAPVPSPNQHVAGLPAAFDEILTRGLAKNPDARYPTADDLVAAARDALGGPAQGDAAPLSQWTPATTPEPPRPPIHPGPPASPVILGPPAAPIPVPPQPPASPDADHRRRRTRRTLAIVAAVAVAAAVVAAVVGVLTVKVSQPGIPAWGAQQTELPFGQLHGPRGVAVDTAGNVFVIDFDRDRISSHQRGRVLKLAAGADHPTELPFPDLDFPNGIAVDATGSVYVTGGNAEQLSMLKPETTTPTPVFTGITLNGVAVDSGGNVYASDAISRVWRLTAGTDELAALHTEQDPSGVAVDTAGAVYITVTNGTSDGGQVLRLAES